MTIADFQRHLTHHNCTCKPIEGGNLTGIGLILTNPALKRSYCLQLYKGGEVSETTIIQACDSLGIPYPNQLTPTNKNK